MTVRIQVVDDLPAAATAAFLSAVRGAIARQGRCTVALSGGSTPRALYDRLRPDDLDWSKVVFFFGDERAVPLADSLSNFRMVWETLLRQVSATIHPLTHAASYEALLRAELGAGGAFDVMLLGMGDDGHTASLFPGSPVLSERQRWVVDAPGVAPAPRRFTVTAPVIQRAREVLVLVGGAGKAKVLQEVIEGPRGKYPSQLLHEAAGSVFWLVDTAASACLAAR